MNLGITILLLVFAAAVLGQDSVPLSDASSTEDSPSRDVSSMPASITYEMVDEKKHRYSISGIYSASQKAMEEAKTHKSDSHSGGFATNPFATDGDSGLSDNYPASIYQGTVPDCDEFRVDFETKICTFLTSRKLRLPELATAIDQMAEIGGDIPYWRELEARDIAKSDHYSETNYTVAEEKENFPSNLAWFGVPGDRQISTLIAINGFDHGQLVFTPTTAHCMAHSRFAIRVLEPDGRLLWHQDSIALASVRFAIADLDSDGFHEILLDRDDHGQASRFLIKRNIKQGTAEQSATAGESK